MMKRTHMFMGIAATIPFINWDNAIVVPIALLGSIAADWDHLIGTKERTVTHSLLALAATSGILMILNYQLGLLWGMNYGLHLLLDSFTLAGVPLFYPFHKKYYGFKLIKTRGAEDMFVALLGLYLITTMLNG
jgi:inner membrane protein